MAKQISLSVSQSCTPGFVAPKALLVLRFHVKICLGRGSSSKPSCVVVGLILFISGGSLRASIPCSPFVGSLLQLLGIHGLPSMATCVIKASKRGMSLMAR